MKMRSFQIQKGIIDQATYNHSPPSLNSRESQKSRSRWPTISLSYGAFWLFAILKKLDCLSRNRIEESPRGISLFSVGCGMWLVMDGAYSIRSASDDEPMLKLSLWLARYIRKKAYQGIKVEIRARARRGEARTSWSKAPPADEIWERKGKRRSNRSRISSSLRWANRPS